MHPAEPYRSVNGQTLAGAPRFTFNVGADYTQPVRPTRTRTSAPTWPTAAATTPTSRCRGTRSSASQALVDLAVGAGKRDKSFDVSVIVKNLFNNETPQARTWNSVHAGHPRTFGIQFTGKL